MSKTNKELISELTCAYITSWNSKEKTSPLLLENAKKVYLTFKELVESTADNQN